MIGILNGFLQQVDFYDRKLIKSRKNDSFIYQCLEQGSSNISHEGPNRKYLDFVDDTVVTAALL